MLMWKITKISAAGSQRFCHQHLMTQSVGVWGIRSLHVTHKLQITHPFWTERGFLLQMWKIPHTSNHWRFFFLKHASYCSCYGANWKVCHYNLWSQSKELSCLCPNHHFKCTFFLYCDHNHMLATCCSLTFSFSSIGGNCQEAECHMCPGHPVFIPGGKGGCLRVLTSNYRELL